MELLRNSTLFFSNDTSVSLRGREDKFITHLFLST